MKLEFADWLSRKRERRKKETDEQEGSQQWLAERVGVSTGMISHFERGAELPTDDKAEAILDALGVTSPTGRRNVLQMIVRDRRRLAGKEQSAANQYKFGEVLRTIFEERDISPIQFHKASGGTEDAPPSTISLWLAGRKLPSDETLTEKIIPALKKLRVPEAELEKLKLAHFEDVMKKALALSYLNKNKRAALLNSIVREFQKQPG